MVVDAAGAIPWDKIVCSSIAIVIAVVADFQNVLLLIAAVSVY